LREVTDAQAATTSNAARVGGLLARDHPEERRLAGPVAAYETDPIALGETQGEPIDEGLPTEGERDSIENDEAHGGASISTVRRLALRAVPR
jgi:hypothetical protein